MPMLDVFIPEGALQADREERLVAHLTDVLLRWEGADPANLIARSIAWVFVHRPAAVYVAGARATVPRYKAIASVPEGQLDDARRSGLAAAVTNAILDAEEGHERDPARVWVFCHEIPDGTWAGAGRIFRLEDIATLVLGDPVAGRAHAHKRLAASRASRATIFGAPSTAKPT